MVKKHYFDNQKGKKNTKIYKHIYPKINFLNKIKFYKNIQNIKKLK